jgi:hypothetical protein
MKLVTIDDCVRESERILVEAGKVETRADHVRVWDQKVEVLNVVNQAFETGYWVGDNYNKLWEAKYNLIKAEKVAGNRSIETYAKK